MEIFDNPDRIKLAFGIPFFNMDFNELMLTVGERAGAKEKTMIFAPSFPWLMDYAKYPNLCPDCADFILPTDSEMVSLAEKAEIKLKMPLEYFEIPEQIARICAHYGFSLLHVSESALKTDILIRDGYVPLSWDLFTNFKTTGDLDEIDIQSIVGSANNLRPDIVLISAPPESISSCVPKIYEQLHNCVLICVPQDMDKNKVADKLDNIFIPLLLLREEINFLDEIKRKASMALPSSVRFDESSIPPTITISGTLDAGITPDLIRTGTRMLKRNFSPALDLSATHATSVKGMEALCFLSRKFRDAGKKLRISEISDELQNTLHSSGVLSYFVDYPGILDDL
ncbi:anti-sigma factor antagonist [Desulfovibrio sp. JC022]|uniref:anti-sigma factor antagonist n=1 Tax=Desulfovibrio sp. JC022 TaxID=2593642 RepID=UPI0013D2106E|nr:anti-sigma factor antagonist [Desulfovibrio sp. JC022]